MEEIQKNDSQAPATPGCINCGHLIVVHGYPNALCAECRDNFTRLQVPKWVIFVAIAIGLCFLFSIYKIPKNIGLGIHLEKANTALGEKNYLTAQRELEKIINKAPENLEIQSGLMISSFYNEDLVTFNKMANALSGKKFDDEDLLSSANNVISQAGLYFPSDSFMALQHRYNDNTAEIPDQVYDQYIAENKEEPYPLLALANNLFDKKSYIRADSVLTNLLVLAPQHIPGLNLMTVLKREENKLDESLVYCDRILAINKQSVFGLATKARTYLKQKKDTEALALALKSYKLDETSPYATASLVLVYHFTNKKTERDQFLNKMARSIDSTTAPMLEYIKDVINGKEFFRN